MPASTAPVEFDVIVTSNCLLIVKLDSVKSTLAIFCFGSGVYKVLSVDDSSRVVNILKSDGLISDAGRAPSQIPITVVIPLSVRLSLATLVILAKVFVDSPGFENATRFPTVAIPTNRVSEVVTVLIPPLTPVILTCPILVDVDCVVSAVNVRSSHYTMHCLYITNTS